MAAKDLLAVYGGFQGHIGEEGLGYRGQQGDQFFGTLAGRGVFAVLGGVQLHSHIAGEGTTALVQRFHGQQHAAHVRMHDDRVSHLVLGHRTGRRAALDAVAGVFHGVLVAALAQGQALDTDAQTLVVHHGEHGGQPLVRRIDDPAGGAVEVHHAGGRSLDAHLVFDGTAGQRILLTERTVVIDHDLGHQEQRDAFRAGRGVRQLGQHQVDDVLGQVVLAAGDKDLGAGDLEAAIGLRFSLGADNAQVSAGVGFGQAHGAGPDARVHVRQVFFFQLFASVGIDRQAGPGGQHGVQAERQVGRVDHFLDLGRDHLGHAHAAEYRVATDTNPATLGVGLVGLGEAGRGFHHAIGPAAAFLIATAVKRGDGTSSNLAGLFENSGGGVFVHHFSQAGELRPQLGNFKHFIEHEAHIAQGSFVVSHGADPRTNQQVYGCA